MSVDQAHRGRDGGRAPEAEEPMTDAASTLLVFQEAHRQHRAAEAQILAAAAMWADQHGDHDLAYNDGYRGRFVRPGGDGTPSVWEFCFDDMAIALERHPMSARALTADALDLRHRLPLFWGLVLDGRVECWVARKIAWHTRHLSREQVAAIDDRIAGSTQDAVTLPPARLKELVEALVIDADNAQRDAERDAARRHRFVRIDQHQQAPGISGVYGKVDDLGGQQLDATLDRIAAALAAAGDTDCLDLRRSKALAILGTPALALRILLCGVSTGSTTGHGDEPPGDQSDEAVLARLLSELPVEKLMPTAILYLHLTDHTLFGTGEPGTGVARWEGVGPITRRHVLDLLGHSQVQVKPVFIPSEARPSDSYEYAGRLRDAVHLTVPADVYPYAVCTNRRIDIDHPDPYIEGGPPGQTGLHNAGPLTRHHHRIKTHGRMHVRQPGPGTYVWRSSHHQYRMTNPSGTHLVDPMIGDALYGSSAGEAQLAGLLLTARR